MRKWLMGPVMVAGLVGAGLGVGFSALSAFAVTTTQAEKRAETFRQLELFAEIVAKASSHECWVSARLDLDAAMASLTPGSRVPQSFHHLRERNLALIRRSLPELTRPRPD